MAQRHAQGAQEISRPQETTNLIPVSATIDPKPRTDETGRLPTSHGKLQEIDLGDEARSRNIKETERAQRMLRGDPLETDMDDAPTKPVKVRLGPDGKPWRSRRKRRASEDLKRDLLVDAVLRENRRKSPCAQPAQFPGTEGYLPHLLTRLAYSRNIRYRTQFIDDDLAAKRPRTG